MNIKENIISWFGRKSLITLSDTSLKTYANGVELEFSPVPAIWKRKTTYITSEELKNIWNVPKYIIPTPTPGYFVSKATMFLRYVHGTTPYTMTGTATLKVNDDSSNSIVTLFTLNGLTASHYAIYAISAQKYDGGKVRVTTTGTSPTVGDGYLIIVVDYTEELILV